MPLSEHEQALLAQMEEALVAADPKFASQMRGSYDPARRRRWIVGALIVLVGLAVVLAGVTIQTLALGVAGFVLMLVGAAYAFTPRKASLGVVAADGSVSKKRSSKPGLIDRMDQRWEQRERD